MAVRQRKSRAFSVFMSVLIILLILCIALFIYASATNGVIQPRLPGKGIFALRTILQHG